jgi:predicted peroxiredoxin
MDYNEDSEPYNYLMDNLIRNGVEFLVSEEASKHLKYTELSWPNSVYKSLILKRFKAVAADICNL